MTEQTSPFLCCAQQKMAIFFCPRCRDLAAYCQNCATLFSDLHKPKSGLYLQKGTTISCQKCQHTFSGAEGWRKYLATQRELVAAGFSDLAHCADIELKPGLPEEEDKVNSGHMLDRIGWDGKVNPYRTSASLPDTSPKGSNVRVLLILLVMVSLIAGIYYSYDYFFPAPLPPPPPAKAPVKK